MQEQAVSTSKDNANDFKPLRARVRLAALLLLALTAASRLSYSTRAMAAPPAQATTLSAEGTALLDQGDFKGALDRFMQVLPLVRRDGDRAGEALTLWNIGKAYAGLRRYAQALDSLQQALAIAREIGNRGGEGVTLANIGAVYSARSQYAQALGVYQQALVIVREAGNRRNEGAVLNLLGVMYGELRQYSKALDVLQQALIIRRDVGDRAGEGSTLGNLGLTYSNLGQYEQALEYYQQSLAIRKENGDRAGERTLFNNIGGVYYRLGQYDRALDFYRQALAIAHELGRAWEAVPLDNLGLVYVNLGQFPQGIDAFQQALAIERDIGDRTWEGLVLGDLGSAHERQGDFERALDFYQQAIAVQEDIRAAARIEELRSSLSAQTNDFYQSAARLLLQLGRTSEAFALTERSRARSFLDQLGNSRLDLSKGANPQLLQQEQSLRAEIGSLDAQLRLERSKPADEREANLIQSLSSQLAAKQSAYSDLITQLKLSDPESASLVSISPLTLAQVQQLLDLQTTLVSYSVTADRTVAFIVTHASLQEIDLAVRASDLEATITRFRAFADRNNAIPPTLQQLYAQLIAPLRDQLTTPVVGIIPNGIFHYLPFAALSDGQQFFGDQRVLFELPSASVLPFIQQKRKGHLDTALVIGQSQAEGLPPLRNVEQETQSIAQLYHATPLIGHAATATAFKAQASRYNVLHIAAHGEFNAARPLFSRIFLEPDAGNDGSLTVQDVYGLNLTQADLVVLSACQTQLGAQSKGDDVVGLTRAFMYAGSASVIASLWTVDDAATGLLMTSFHQHLQAGMSKAAALQAAQADTRALYPDPFYWAAFVLTGDPGTSP